MKNFLLCLPLRHCEERSNEAIHNLSNQKIFNGEIRNYGFALKRVNLLTQMHTTNATHSCNDKVESLECRKFCKFSRNDKMKAEI